MTQLFGEARLAANTDPRTPCVLLLDTSGSMEGERIAALNQGLQVLKAELMEDSIAKNRVEIAVVSFSSCVTELHDFVTAADWAAPTLEADGLTHMGEGILKALELVERRKAELRAAHIPYTRPWVMLISDGEPAGEPEHVVQHASAELLQAKDAKKVQWFSVGVADADLEAMRRLAGGEPLMLKGLQFSRLFQWLSRSLGGNGVSGAGMGQVVLPPVSEWAAVDTGF
jgi:uncharacterized protein YegL